MNKLPETEEEQLLWNIQFSINMMQYNQDKINFYKAKLSNLRKTNFYRNQTTLELTGN